MRSDRYSRNQTRRQQEKRRGTIKVVLDRKKKKKEGVEGKDMGEILTLCRVCKCKSTQHPAADASRSALSHQLLGDFLRRQPTLGSLKQKKISNVLLMIQDRRASDSIGSSEIIASTRHTLENSFGQITDRSGQPF